VGLGLGLAAGVSPGPLLTLVISTTLARGFGAGLRVAVAPILTDAPIILITLVLLRGLPASWLAWIGAVGGCIVIYFGVETIRTSTHDRGFDSKVSRSSVDLWRGAVVNFLNPHPWIFWTTVQGPMLIRGWRRDPVTAVAFVIVFYLAIVGSKIAIAWAVARARQALNDRWYRHVLTGCGLLLIGMGLFFIYQATAASFTVSR